MRLDPRRYQVPISVQIGVVAVLFIAALTVLWTTGALVVARERRRSEAKGMLEAAGEQLAAQGGKSIAAGGGLLEYPDEESRIRLDRELSAKAAAALAPHEGRGIEGGYLVLRSTRPFARNRFCFRSKSWRATGR
jgi:hypothetical protein